MNRSNFKVAVVMAILCCAGFSFAVLAQSKVDQGKPGTQGPWPVTFTTPVFPTDGGTPSSVTTVSDYPYICGTNRDTVQVMDGGCQTMGTLNPRLYLVIVNSKDNGSGVIRCRNDATCPILDAGSVGLVLDVGDGVPYSNSTGKIVKCIGVGNFVSVSECGP